MSSLPRRASAPRNPAGPSAGLFAHVIGSPRLPHESDETSVRINPSLTLRCDKQPPMVIHGTMVEPPAGEGQQRADRLRLNLAVAGAVARDPARVPPVAGSAAKGLGVFTRELIGAEVDSHASDFLMQVLNGRLREHVRHFRTPALAVEALKRGEIAAVLGTHTELQAALGDSSRLVLDRVTLPELRVAQWPLGMAVKAEAKPLAEALGRALGELQRSGELARLFAA